MPLEGTSSVRNGPSPSACDTDPRTGLVAACSSPFGQHSRCSTSPVAGRSEFRRCRRLPANVFAATIVTSTASTLGAVQPCVHCRGGEYQLRQRDRKFVHAVS